MHPGLLNKKNRKTWVLSASSYTAPVDKAKPFQEVQHVVQADVRVTRENKRRDSSGIHVTNMQADRPRVVRVKN